MTVEVNVNVGLAILGSVRQFDHIASKHITQREHDAGASSVTIASIRDAATRSCALQLSSMRGGVLGGVGAVCRESYHYYGSILRREEKIESNQRHV